MTVLAVEPEAVFAAGSAVVAAGDGLSAAMSILTSGFGANTGLDIAGEVFGLTYQSTAESLLKLAAALINACRNNGTKVQVCASNYSKAEAASTLGGGCGVLQAPGDPVKTAAPAPPGTLGPGEPPPVLWAVVQSFADDVWPDGDVAGLHAAAGCWRTFGSTASGTQGALNSSKTLIGTQQMPEGGLMIQALSRMGDIMGKLGEQSGKMAATLDGFANQVTQAQSNIRDLLDELESLVDIWGDVVSIFDGDALNDIKRVARDINGVLHDLGREARAFEQGTQLLMQVADGFVVEVEKFTRSQLTHFLGDAVGNPVATALDTFVNANEGVVKQAINTVQGLVDLDPLWFFADPKGATATWKGALEDQLKTSTLNQILHPQEGAAANEKMWKSLLHLDDWSTARPGMGFGEDAFDIATFCIPGIGEAGAGADAGATGAHAAEGAGQAAEGAGAVGRVGDLGDVAGTSRSLGDIGKASTGLTKDLDGLKLDLPKTDLPPGGRPVAPPVDAPGAPQRPVESAPPGTPSPHSPTAPGGTTTPGRPGAPVDPHGRVSAPTPSGGPVGGPHNPLGPASVSAGGPRELASMAAPAEHLPSSTPEMAEAMPTRMPLAADGPSAEPAPAAMSSTPQTPAFASSAPHASTPASAPLSGASEEIPGSDGGGWHVPDGGRASGVGSREVPPHGGGPDRPAEVGPGDGGSDGSPHDGKSDEPDDGSETPGEDASMDGLTDEKRDEIIAMPKGSRPDPLEYLSQDYISQHLEKFDGGATRFMPESNLEKYGIAQRDGTSFVMPKSEADAMIGATGGDLRTMEDDLGLPRGFLDSNKVVRIDVPDPQNFNLRIPSGNEAGANEQWTPGGRLPNGASEAVVDGDDIPPGDYTVTDIFE